MSYLNEDQFSPPVPVDATSTTNWGNNQTSSLSDMLSGANSDRSNTQQSNPFNDDNDRRRRRRKNDKDVQTNPNYGWAVVPALAGAAMGAEGMANSVANLGAGVLGRVQQGADAALGGAGKVGSGILGGIADAAKGAISVGEGLAGNVANFAVDAGKSAGGVGGWLGEQFGNVTDAVGGIAGNVAGAAGKASEAANNIIGDAAGNVAGAVGDFVGTGIDQSKALWGAAGKQLDAANKEHGFTNFSLDGNKSGSGSGAASAGAAAAEAAAQAATNVIPFLDIENQLKQIYYND